MSANRDAAIFRTANETVPVVCARPRNREPGCFFRLEDGQRFIVDVSIKEARFKGDFK